MAGKRSLKSWVAFSKHPYEQRVNPQLHCISVRRVLEDQVSLWREQVIALISSDSLAMAFYYHSLQAIGL